MSCEVASLPFQAHANFRTCLIDLDSWNKFAFRRIWFLGRVFVSLKLFPGPCFESHFQREECNFKKYSKYWSKKLFYPSRQTGFYLLIGFLLSIYKSYSLLSGYFTLQLTESSFNFFLKNIFVVAGVLLFSN